MSTFRATPKIIRSSTSYLMASVCAAVALNMAFLPLGMAAVHAANAQPTATESAAPVRATVAARAIAHTVAGIDHSMIATDAVSAGDVETVEMSIAAYDRVSDVAAAR